jgi:hypothetical protein
MFLSKEPIAAIKLLVKLRKFEFAASYKFLFAANQSLVLFSARLLRKL